MFIHSTLFLCVLKCNHKRQKETILSPKFLPCCIDLNLTSIQCTRSSQRPKLNPDFKKQEGTSDSKRFYPHTHFKDCENVPTTIISFGLDSKTYQCSSTISWKKNPHKEMYIHHFTVSIIFYLYLDPSIM